MSKESKTSKKSRGKSEPKSASRAPKGAQLSDEDLQICNFDDLCEEEKFFWFHILV